MAERQWIVFVRRQDDGARVISVDFALLAAAPDTARPWCVLVTVALRDQTPQGLPGSAENEAIDRFADRLMGEFGGEESLVGQVSGGGAKRLYFHLPRRDVADFVAGAAKSLLPGHVVDCDVSEDREWRTFHGALAPTGRERQAMYDRQIVATLRERGDPLTARRPVTHWAYFADEAARERAAIDLASQGFRIEAKERLEKLSGERPYSLRFARDETADPASVEAFVDVAFDLCSGAGGEYDGWETEVVKPAAPDPPPKKGGLRRFLGG